jgi:imidazole glycerol phosphate synthase glutamine amidotransferase subunit
LFDGSAESPGVPGLGLVGGNVVRFDAPKVPQIGWNHIAPQKNSWDAGYVYFVNSYYPVPADKSSVLYEADYGKPFCAAIQRDTITAFQFHPEKSGPFGQKMLERWIESV